MLAAHRTARFLKGNRLRGAFPRQPFALGNRGAGATGRPANHRRMQAMTLTSLDLAAGLSLGQGRSKPFAERQPAAEGPEQ